MERNYVPLRIRWREIIKSEEYRKIHQGNYHHYEDFVELLAKLEPPLDKRFINIMDEQLDVIPFEFSEIFKSNSVK